MASKSVMIGMSGGVDSSVAALLLKEASFHCVGATMHLWEKGDCRDARTICDQLEIPHVVIDCQAQFRENVIDHFVSSYEAGLTPNPCIHCNRTMKFGLKLKAAMDRGCDYVATGHYARIRRDPDTGRYLLCRAGDAAKDQTYFLYDLTQEQLAQ